MHISGLFYLLPTLLWIVAPLWPSFHLQQLVLSVASADPIGCRKLRMTPTANWFQYLASTMTAVIRRLGASGQPFEIASVTIALAPGKRLSIAQYCEWVGRAPESEIPLRRDRGRAS